MMIFVLHFQLFFPAKAEHQILVIANDFNQLTTTFALFLSRRPQYQPLSLKRLQYLIDLGRVDPTQPIDLTQLVNARGVTVQPLKRDYGVQLVDEVIAACLKHVFHCGLSRKIDIGK